MEKLSKEEKRFYLIWQRQRENIWGHHYEPGIRAIRAEAPGASKPSLVYWPKHSRDLHLMSSAELAACLLALYNPRLIDIQEQKLLSPVPAPHPLQGHPMHAKAHAKSFEGTVAVAERLRLTQHIGWIWVTPLGRTGERDNGNAISPRLRVPQPWLGDLLLCLDGPVGIYCVNWSVKLASGDHGRPHGMRLGGGVSRRRLEKAHARHTIERAYYLDAGIPTREVSKDLVTKDLFDNLASLYGVACRPMPLPDSHREDMECEFAAGIQSQTPPLQVCDRQLLKHRVPREISLRVLYRGIWRRSIRAELCAGPLLPDAPLTAERQDVLSAYAAWFAEE